MNEIWTPSPGEIVLLHTPPREAMLSLVVRMALNGPLLVFDTANQFDAFKVARLIGRQTAQLDSVLSRVQVARAFTCYQVVALFEALPATPMPHVIFDLPATFYDESVTPRESRRLFQIVLSHVERLRRTAPLLISVRPPHGRDAERVYRRAAFLQAVTDLADHIFIWETPAATAPTRLF
jgi:hypothetical protein